MHRWFTGRMSSGSVGSVSSARLVCRSACFIAGFSSAAVTAGSRVQQEPWSGGRGYMDDIDRAIGPLDNFLWALAARGALTVAVIAVLLFALTYWLFGPPRHKA
jgi:hypothetical protein